MKKTVLLATMLASLPGAAPAQEEKGPPPAPRRACQDAPRADSALPARASTRPAPQLGTVAPNIRVPSHTATPSRRAMAAASARDEKTTSAANDADHPCADGAAPHAPASGAVQAAED